MSTTVTSDSRAQSASVGAGVRGSGGGGNSRKPGGGSDDIWPPGFTRDDAIEPNKFRVGMWAGMASILMLFVSLTSAYILRQSRGLSEAHDWFPLPLPGVLWLTTATLLASSLTIELARRALRRGRYGWFRLLISLTALLGLGFLAGQLRAWRQIMHRGFYLSANPNSSFFYVLTGMHGVHLIAGILALLYAGLVVRWRSRSFERRRVVLDVTSWYWHSMAVLWVYIFGLLKLVELRSHPASGFASTPSGNL